MAVSAVNSQFLYREIHIRDQLQSICNSGSYCVSVVNGVGLWSSGESAIRSGGKKWKRDVKVEAAFWQNIEKPKFVEMEPITDMEQLDQILLQAQQLSQPIVIDWMASWCRKCIYLKPKLEKLAAEYHTRLKFYCVDVNNVPQTLVKRGNISKMPTIQLWKDGEMKEEVIGGHKAWLVIDEVRAMIQKYV